MNIATTRSCPQKLVLGSSNFPALRRFSSSLLLCAFALSLLFLGLPISASPSTDKAAAAEPLKPIPDRLVVLTFDDGNKTDIEVVAPLLKKYGFGATFFITEGLGADKDKKTFLTWEEVQQLDKLGFEIGNHTRRHLDASKQPRDELDADLAYIEERCEKLGIARPVSFCYPGYRHGAQAVEVLKKRTYRFARRGNAPEIPQEREGGRGLAYDPAVDHPLLIPSTGAAGPKFTYADLVWAVDQARDGKICVLTFHGVPARLHPWVTLAPEEFERYLMYLKQQNCKVIALRDLGQYVDPTKAVGDPYDGINSRLKAKSASK